MTLMVFDMFYLAEHVITTKPCVKCHPATVDEDQFDLSPPRPPPPPVQATGLLQYTGDLLIDDSELNLADGEVRHRFWGACVNEVRLLLPSSAIMRDMRRDRGIQQGLDFPLFCNLTVEEIEGAIADLRGKLPATDPDYRNHLGRTRDLVDARATPCDPRTAELYRLLVANCLPPREGLPHRGVWEERCRVRDTVQVLAPVLVFRDLEFLCSPSNIDLALQRFLDDHRDMWLDRNTEMDYLRSVGGDLHLLAQFREDIEQQGSDLDSAAETAKSDYSVSVDRSDGSESVGRSVGSSVGSESDMGGGKRRKPATKRKGRRSASSKRKPAASKRRRTTKKASRRRHNTRRR